MLDHRLVLRIVFACLESHIWKKCKHDSSYPKLKCIFNVNIEGFEILEP